MSEPMVIAIIGLGAMVLGTMSNIVAIRVDWLQSMEQRARSKGPTWVAYGSLVPFLGGFYALISETFLLVSPFPIIFWGGLSLAAALGSYLGGSLLRDRILKEGGFQAGEKRVPTLLEKMLPAVILYLPLFVAFFLGIVLHLQVLGRVQAATVFFLIFLLFFNGTIWPYKRMHTRWVEQARKEAEGEQQSEPPSESTKA